MAGAASDPATWSGQRAFTNEEAWTISDVLTGEEGLAKWGSGDLTLSAKNSFTGDVLLAGGTTFLATPDDDVVDTAVGALGNPRVARTVVVTNATLRLVGQNSFGGSGRSTTPIKTVLKFYDSTLDLTTNFAFNAGDVYLHDSTVKFHGGLSYGSYANVDRTGTGGASWGSFFANNLYFSGTKAVTFENEVTTLTDGQYRNAGLSVGKFASDGKVNLAQQGVINVPDMTGSTSSDVILHVPLLWTSGANAPSSGFRKTGVGTLEFSARDDNSSARWSNYTGDVDVVEGTLKFGVNNVSTSVNRPTAMGTACIPHTFTVHTNGTIWLSTSDVQGQFYATNLITLHVKGGTYTQSNGSVNGLGPVIIEDAASVNFGNASSGDNNYWYIVSPGVTNQYVAKWPSVGFNGGVKFRGTKACTLSNGNSTYFFGVKDGTESTDIDVPDLTASTDTDVTLSGRLVDAPAWYNRTNQGSDQSDPFWARRYITKTNHLAQALNLRKTGAGTLELANTASDTRGRIEIAGGTLRIGSRGNSQYVATTSALGDLSDSNRVALVLNSATLELRTSDTLGQAACVNNARFIVSNSTIRSTGKWANAFPYLDLYNATFDYTGGLGTGEDIGPYGAFIFAQRVTWDGTEPYNLPFVGSNGYFALGFQDDFYTELRSDGLTNWHGKCEFRVMDITKDARADVTLGVPLKTEATWPNGPRWGKTVRFRTGLLKTGPGTLVLNGTDPQGKYYDEATRVKEGALLVDTHRFRSTNVLVQAGAFVGGTGTISRVTLAAGAGFTAAPGQTVPLTLTAVELPADDVVRLDVPCLDLACTGVRVPVVKATGLESAKWSCTVNGAAAPNGYRVSAVTANGVVYGVYARSGCTIFIR